MAQYLVKRLNQIFSSGIILYHFVVQELFAVVPHLEMDGCIVSHLIRQVNENLDDKA